MSEIDTARKQRLPWGPLALAGALIALLAGYHLGWLRPPGNEPGAPADTQAGIAALQLALELQVGNEQILVGLTPGRIEKLHTLAEPLPLPGEGEAATASFADKINRLMGDRGAS